MTVGNTKAWVDTKTNGQKELSLAGHTHSYAASTHTHTKAQITDFPSSLPASDVYSWAKASSKPSYAWSEITGKPSTFTPSAHTHSASEVGAMSAAWTSLMSTNFTVSLTNYMYQFRRYSDLFLGSSIISALSDYLEMCILITGTFSIIPLSTDSDKRSASIYCGACYHDFNDRWNSLMTFTAAGSTTGSAITSSTMSAKIWLTRDSPIKQDGSNINFYPSFGYYNSGTTYPIISTNYFKVYLVTSSTSDGESYLYDGSKFTGTCTLYARNKLGL